MDDKKLALAALLLVVSLIAALATSMGVSMDIPALALPGLTPSGTLPR